MMPGPDRHRPPVVGNHKGDRTLGVVERNPRSPVVPLAAVVFPEPGAAILQVGKLGLTVALAQEVVKENVE
jgi:hypothetical protein